MASDRIQEAYRCLSTATPPDVRKNIYKSLLYVALYQPPPAGFEKAIGLFDEYNVSVQEVASGGLWVNCACAYGQKFRYLSEHRQPGEPPPALSPEMVLAREAALNAIRRAIAIDPNWTELLRRQLQKDYKDREGKPKDANENDLEAFESDSEFRAALGLV